MGQYHAIYNLDKKEYMIPHKVCAGAKILEWQGSVFLTGLAVLLANSNGRGGGDLYVHVPIQFSADGTYVEGTPTAAIQAQRYDIAQVSGRWAGDRIVVQGDYAQAGDKAFLTEEELQGFKDISHLVVNALAADAYLREEMAKDWSVKEGQVVLPDYSETPAKKARKPRAKKAKPAA